MNGRTSRLILSQRKRETERFCWMLNFTAGTKAVPWICVCYWPPPPGCLTKPKVLFIDCLAPQPAAMWTPSINAQKVCLSARYRCDPSALAASLPDEPNYFLSPCLKAHTGTYRHTHTQNFSACMCWSLTCSLNVLLSALFHCCLSATLTLCILSFILCLFSALLCLFSALLFPHPVWSTWPYRLFFRSKFNVYLSNSHHCMFSRHNVEFSEPQPE